MNVKANEVTPQKNAPSRSLSDIEDDREEVRTMIMEPGGHRNAGVYDWNTGKAGTLVISLPQTATTASAPNPPSKPVD